MAPRLRPLLPLLLLLAACAAPSPSASSPAATPTPTTMPVATQSVLPSPVSAYPLTLTDDAGRSVTLDADPHRIVSLAPSNTEIVCAVASCDRLVGVTDFDDYPPEVTDIEKVVTFAQVDVEKVVATNPDLVLAAGNELTPTAVIDQLAALGLPVLVLYPQDLDGVYADIELVGRAMDLDAAARVLTGLMQARVATVQARAAGLDRPRTFYEVSVYQGTIYTAGEGSFLASLIDTAGGDPITGDAASTSIQLDDLVAADPQLILLGDAAYDSSVTADSVAQRPGWEGMSAVQDERVVPMPEDLVITRPGPRIVDGLEALARAIHPEAFR